MQSVLVVIVGAGLTSSVLVLQRINLGLLVPISEFTMAQQAQRNRCILHYHRSQFELYTANAEGFRFHTSCSYMFPAQSLSHRRSNISMWSGVIDQMHLSNA